MKNDDFISIVELWRIFYKKKKIILLISFCTSIITLVVSLFIPKTFEANATLLMPEASEGTGGISGALGLFSPRISGEGVINSQIIKSMLRSKRCRKMVVRKFNLLEVYNKEIELDAIETLKKRTKIGIFNLKGEIKIQVKGRKPELIANICNFYIETLDTLNKELNISTEANIVKVLDYAEPPMEKSFPKTKLNVVVSFCLSFLILMSYYAISKKI